MPCFKKLIISSRARVRALHFFGTILNRPAGSSKLPRGLHISTGVRCVEITPQAIDSCHVPMNSHLLCSELNEHTEKPREKQEGFHFLSGLFPKPPQGLLCRV